MTGSIDILVTVSTIVFVALVAMLGRVQPNLDLFTPKNYIYPKKSQPVPGLPLYVLGFHCNTTECHFMRFLWDTIQCKSM